MTILLFLADPPLRSVASWKRARRLGPLSHVVIEVPLSAHTTPEPENVGRNKLGVQFDVVASPLPQVAGIAEQVVRLVGLLRVEAEALERKICPARLDVVGIEVHDDQNDVC